MSTMIVLTALMTCIGSNGEGDEQSCEIDKWAPIGTVNQNNYKFEYQSGVGDGGNGFACLIHRAQNVFGSQLTTVKWAESSSRNAPVLLYAVLEERLTATGTIWHEAVDVTVEPVGEDKTYLGFGLNGNQFNVQPGAYRKQAQAAKQWPPLTTILRRIFQVEGQPPQTVLGIRVSSTVEGEKGGYTINYKVSMLDRENTYEILAPRTTPEQQGALGIIWEDVAGVQFLGQLKDLQSRTLSNDRREATFKIPAADIELIREKPLQLIHRKGEQVRTILATSAAAYIPKRPQ